MITKEQILAQFFGIENAVLKKLDGYISTNYRVDTENDRFVLKIYPKQKEIIDFVVAENKVQHCFQGNNHFPQIIANKQQQQLTISEDKVYRLLSYVEGNFLAESPSSTELMSDFGCFLAQMDLQLQGFKSYVIEARKFEWDLQFFQETVSPKVELISNLKEQKLVKHFLLQHRQEVVPILHKLQKQIIHNDANDWNVLTDNNKICGIIDFGDVCHTQRINELAIALSYACMNKENPLEWAYPVVEAYHKIYPLTELELDALYWLIAARLCTSVCNSAEEKQKQPDNTYILISEKPAWDLLHKWISINPATACNHFRKVCGFAPASIKSLEEVQEERFHSIHPIFSVSYKKPIYMERAAFQYMYDRYGNTFLDAYNNIPHVGHSHPKVVEAGQKQMAKLNTNTRYLYDQINEYSAHLLRYFPKKLNKVFFVNSGSAASDLAIRLVQNYTEKKRIAALEHGYHGNTHSVIEISHYKFAGKGGKGVSESVLPLPMPDAYRGEFTTDDAGNLYAQQAIKQLHENEIAAFIAEPIVGCGGQVPLAKGYLKEVYAAVRDQEGLCISDEVQTGFGRLGDYFWGYEMYDVLPDLVILGKPMGNGHPIGAVVTTDEIADSFNNGMEFFSSFGGNPVSCAIGQSVLNVIEEEELQTNAKQVGDYYLSQLRALQIKHECIGDVRGSGLFIGFEFVKDRTTLEPDTALAAKVKNEMRDRFVLLSTDGPYDNVIKSKPPLCFSKENVDHVIGHLDEILSKV